MKHSFLAVRAIATILTKRIYKPVAITVAAFSVFFIAIMIWLLTISAWWLLLAIPVFIVIIALAALLVLAWLVIKTVAPDMTKQQRQAVSQFVDHVQELSEITQTPKAILLYRVVKDAISPKKTAYIESVISGVGSLKREYEAIVSEFSSAR